MIKDIVIVGGGSAGWMTAMIMAHRWQNTPITISLVESPDIGVIGVGEGSTPALKKFFTHLNIEESEWMPACNATYKVGITFDGWSTKPGFTSYHHPFPAQLDERTLPDFKRNISMRLRGANIGAHPDDFFLASYLAKQYRGPKADYNFPFESDYGYHFDSVLLGKFLRQKAKSLGVKHVTATVVDVSTHTSGDIDSIILNSGERLTAELFVDCSGFKSLLMQKALNVEVKSYKSELFNDSALAVPTEISETIPSETVSSAMKHGWAWKIPLTNRYGNGYVYSSSYCSDDDAELELRTKLGLLDSDAEIRLIKMNIGRLTRHWHKNCVAVGLSQGFIEPLEATALFLIQQTAAIFVENFEKGNYTNSNQEKFNNEINGYFDGIKDYIVTHYRTNSRRDTDYWKDCSSKDAPISDSLKAMYQAWGQGLSLDEEISRQGISKYYNSLSWHCIFAGMGLFPKQELLQQPKSADFQVNLQKTKDFMSRCALNYPLHHLQVG